MTFFIATIDRRAVFTAFSQHPYRAIGSNGSHALVVGFGRANKAALFIHECQFDF